MRATRAGVSLVGGLLAKGNSLSFVVARPSVRQLSCQPRAGVRAERRLF